MWAQVAQTRKNLKFLVKVAHKGQIPLTNFYQIRRGGGNPRSAPSLQISLSWL